MADMPFFMRFVERQDQTASEPRAEELRTGVTAGADKGDKPRKSFEKGMETMKWPSDGDDCIYW